ncbi:MAG: UMP kinase [Planctomycetota bacterium]
MGESSSDGPPRVLLKLSGEALCEAGGHGVEPGALTSIVEELATAAKQGSQIGIVVGGGNFLRGATLSSSSIDRTSADAMGMMGTIMNGLALESALKNADVPVQLFSAIQVGTVVHPYGQRECEAALARGEVVILAGGTGHPFFTTDTCASLRAVQIGAGRLLKGTKVDGVYSADPKKDPTATRYSELSYQDVLAQGLQVMDATAVAMCMEYQLPVMVFDMFKKGNLSRALLGEPIGTVVS